MLERYLIRYFLAVVDQGSFSRAAAHCHVSQPTLSAGIAKLEKMLEAVLFFRSNQRVQLTAAGTRFLDHARRIESEFNLARQSMHGDAAPAMLRLGVLGSIPGAAVAAALGTALADTRGHGVELVQGSERDLVGRLARGRIEAALTLVDRGGDRFLETPLRREGYALALPSRHPLAGRASVAAEELAGETMIVRRHCEALSDISRHFTERGVRPPFAMRSTNDERVLAMIAAGVGLTVMPASYHHPGVTRVALAGFTLARTLGLAFAHHAEHLDREPPPVLAAIAAAFASDND